MSDEEFICDFFKRIDAGEVRWVSGCQCAWDDTFAGNVEFVSDDGDRMIVFNDCGEWDYIDTVVAGGRKLDHWREIRRLSHGWSPRDWSVMRMIEPQYLRSPLNEDKSNCPCRDVQP